MLNFRSFLNNGNEIYKHLLSCVAFFQNRNQDIFIKKKKIVCINSKLKKIFLEVIQWILWFVK